MIGCRMEGDGNRGLGVRGEGHRRVGGCRRRRGRRYVGPSDLESEGQVTRGRCDGRLSRPFPDSRKNNVPVGRTRRKTDLVRRGTRGVRVDGSQGVEESRKVGGLDFKGRGQKDSVGTTYGVTLNSTSLIKRTSDQI